MALFRITVKQKVRTNGIVLDPGMSVEVSTLSMSDPVHTNGGQVVADAFMRIYGVDIKKAGALNGVYWIRIYYELLTTQIFQNGSKERKNDAIRI